MRKPFTNHGHIFVPTTRAMDSRGRAIWRARLLRFIHRVRGHFHLRVCQSPSHPGGGARSPSRCNAKQQGDSVNQARVCLSEIAAIYRPLHFGPMSCTVSVISNPTPGSSKPHAFSHANASLLGRALCSEHRWVRTPVSQDIIPGLGLVTWPHCPLPYCAGAAKVAWSQPH